MCWMTFHFQVFVFCSFVFLETILYILAPAMGQYSKTKAWFTGGCIQIYKNAVSEYIYKGDGYASGCPPDQLILLPYLIIFPREINKLTSQYKSQRRSSGEGLIRAGQVVFVK